MNNIDILYLTGRADTNFENVFVSPETFICLFVYHYCDLKLQLAIVDTEENYSCIIPLASLCDIKCDYRNGNEPFIQDIHCLFPAIVTEQGKTIIAGLCGVLRWAIKAHLILFPDHYSKHLLGFRGGCLVACTESSIWTRFCELQLPNAVKEISSKIKCGDSLEEIPKNLALLEAHLKRPVRTHNILKRKLDIAKKVKKKKSIKVEENNTVDENAELSLEAHVDFTLYDQNNKPIEENDIQQTLQNMVITEKSEDFSLNHCYLEGIDLTLADMIVFPCVHYLLCHLPLQARLHLINIVSWYKRMWSHELISTAAEKIGISLQSAEDDCVNDENNLITFPDIDQISLYKQYCGSCWLVETWLGENLAVWSLILAHLSSLARICISTCQFIYVCAKEEKFMCILSTSVDPSHSKLRCKHRDPFKIIAYLMTENICTKYSESYSTKLNWSTIPSILHPAKGDLPKKRLDRKCQQIESMVTVVLSIAKDGDTIVEFCSGGGHVGLLLAHYLPNCKVLLIENKESSMIRAKSRAENLNIQNVYFYQCNLDYFQGTFDIGISLHACGVVTDLVIQQCIKNRASFVCCPCCYGNIQDTHLLSYPRSEKFRSTNLSKMDYRLLAHFADRNELNTPTADQGEICMGLVDMDRIYYAKEQGYKAELTTLQPITCSPKHNLLIGQLIS